MSINTEELKRLYKESSDKGTVGLDKNRVKVAVLDVKDLIDYLLDNIDDIIQALEERDKG